MPLLETLVAGMRWGLLLITDAQSRELFDPDATPDQVHRNETGVIVPVLHAAEGEVTVRLWSDRLDVPTQATVFDGEVSVPSGLLRIGAADDSVGIVVTVATGRQRLVVSVDDPIESQVIDIWASPSA